MYTLKERIRGTLITTPLCLFMCVFCIFLSITDRDSKRLLDAYKCFIVSFLLITFWKCYPLTLDGIDKQRINEEKLWIEENTGWLCYIIRIDNDSYFVLFFSEVDVMAFKLRWA